MLHTRIKQAGFYLPQTFRPPSSLHPLQKLISLGMLCLLLLTNLITGWPFHIPIVSAASLKNNPPVTVTAKTFFKQGTVDHVYHGPFIRPPSIPAIPGMPAASKNTTSKNSPISSNAAPATMKPLTLVLDSSLLKATTKGNVTATQNTKPLALKGSDGHLEVLIPQNVVDASHATVGQSQSPTGALTLKISQISGREIDPEQLLSTYQLQVVDSKGQSVHQLTWLQPLTIRYHYTMAEMAALHFDPHHIFLKLPNLTTVSQVEQSIMIPLTNNAQTQTLTTSVTIQNTARALLQDTRQFAFASTASVPLTPAPLMASMNGNDGQLSYSYPLSVPPGPGGLTPKLTLSYSSLSTNTRHDQHNPADSIGDGWSLSLGAITLEGSHYFLHGIDGVSDRLVTFPTDQNRFETQNISHLRIVLTIDSTTNIKCFHIWDRSGTYYELGCTPDSRQLDDVNTPNSIYRWDLNRVVAPTNTASQVKTILVSYLQDKGAADTVNNPKKISVRDSGIKQIVYGIAASLQASALAQVDGTIDFHYHAPVAQGTWADAYGNNYHCSSAPPQTTTLRCDDEPFSIKYDQASLSSAYAPAPDILSTLTLDSITSYIGKDDTTGFPAYRYSFSYQDDPFTTVHTDLSQPGAPFSYSSDFAGNHLLIGVQPTIYQQGKAIARKGLTLGYTSRVSNYYGTDLQGTVTGLAWKYLNSYLDLDSGVGGKVTYRTAHANALGTPVVTDANGNVIDDRLDPFYCDNQANNSNTAKRCQGNYGDSNFSNNDYHSWSVQVVTQLQTLGTDSGNSALKPATTTFNYALSTSTNAHCNPVPDPNHLLPPQEQQCVGDYWTSPNTSADAPEEFRGFNVVYTTNPSGNLIADYYYTAEGWATPAYDALNYNGGQLYQEDVYWGNQAKDSALLRRTVNTYTGFNGFVSSCNTNTDVDYAACSPLLFSSRTTYYEQTGTSNSLAPWVQTNNTYDDYSSSSGITIQGAYHNLLTSTTYSSDAPRTVKKWSYQPNDQVAGVNNTIYYTVTPVTHSELDDSTGHVWQCQDTSYDEGSSSDVPTPSAGLPTTETVYGDCKNQSQTALTTYTGYDAYGNVVANVDAFGAANSTLYHNSGCTLSTPPTYLSGAWTAGRYTSCLSYDSYLAQPVQKQNVFGQTNTTSYDYTQDGVPLSTTDINGQIATTAYSFNSSGDPIVQVKQPGENGSFTNQTSANSLCTSSSTTPCYEVDAISAQYPNATSRTFYDSMGRVVEKRVPGPDALHDTVTFTIYNDGSNTVFQSVPFRVLRGSAWVDPNTAKDDTGIVPGGTITAKDPLGQVLAIKDVLNGSSVEPGISCPQLSGTWTTCYTYGVGSVAGDNQSYTYATITDANNHMTARFTDVLGRERYTLWYSQPGSISSNITTSRETRYNVLDLPTAVITKDLVPQTGQTITSVTATATYDDLGRITSINDPDQGVHTYTYDADSRLLTNVSGSHTLGVSYDLLGRARCAQDMAPPTDGSGNCSSGSHPLLQITYDKSMLGSVGSTDFPLGQMTQAVSTTYYPDGSAVATTQLYQHDLRGRSVSTTLQIAVPTSWNVTNTLPTYQQNTMYNDADQVAMTQTMVGGQAGYTFSQVYDNNSGILTGLSNNTTAIANLATLGYDTHGNVSDLNFLSSSGTNIVPLANDHFSFDADLRPISAAATWQSGSASTGSFFNSSRAYDPAGNVLSASTTFAAIPGQTSSGGADTQNFCYDEQNRLVWAGNTGTEPSAGNGTCGTAPVVNTLAGAGYNASYAYTHLGQLWQAPLNGQGAQQQYLYCDATHPHQLTGVYPVGTTCVNQSGPTYSAAYDNWGNVTQRVYNATTAQLSYDLSNHFVQWNAGATSQEWYAYDASGQRVLRRSTGANGTTLTTYAFGLEEHTYNAIGINLDNTYYYSIGGRQIGELHGTTTQFFLIDELGSPVATFSAVAGSAVVLGNQLFGPYGSQRYSVGTMGTAKGFTGQYQDSLTGLDYYTSRYYDPVLGRFLTADTTQGNAQGMDPYAYVSNNPMSANDPGGHCPWCIVGFVVGAIVDYGMQVYNNYQNNVTDPWTTNIDIWSILGSGIMGASIGAEAAPFLDVGWGALFGGEGAIGAAGTATGIGVASQPEENDLPPPPPEPVAEPVAPNPTPDPPETVTPPPPDPVSVQAPTESPATVAPAQVSNTETAAPSSAVSTTSDATTNTATEGACSFTAATPVTTDHSKQPIGTLKVGEKVLAYNPTTKKMELQPILHVWIHKDDDLVDLTITLHSGHGNATKLTREVIHTNKKHPFFTLEKGFLPVAQMKLGMHVVEADGLVGVISGWKLVSGVQTMYNLEVAQDHTFTVGVGQWVVHNCTDFEGKIQDALASSSKGAQREGRVARLIQQYSKLVNFQNLIENPDGTPATDIDAETPNLIIETTTSKSGKADNIMGRILNPLWNPQGKGVVLHANYNISAQNELLNRMIADGVTDEQFDNFFFARTQEQFINILKLHG